MSNDEVEMNFQSGAKADPDCDENGYVCQTRIGIGAPRIRCIAIGLILESEVTVIIDQYQCVKTDVSISEV